MKLSERVDKFVETMRELVPKVSSPTDWAPLEEFIDVNAFERVGVFMEVQNWQQYTEMLTRWASAIDSFETPVRRISELPGLVYYEVEERHTRGGTTHVVNSMTVFQFNEAGEIQHLDVYLQQAR